MKAIEVHFDIGKQKVVYILKCKERNKEAARNALRMYEWPVTTNGAGDHCNASGDQPLCSFVRIVRALLFSSLRYQ
jgi:hypothetical protein